MLAMLLPNLVSIRELAFWQSNFDFDVELAEGDWHLLGMVDEEAFVVSGNPESFSL